MSRLLVGLEEIRSSFQHCAISDLKFEISHNLQEESLLIVRSALG